MLPGDWGGGRAFRLTDGRNDNELTTVFAVLPHLPLSGRTRPSGSHAASQAKNLTSEHHLDA